jgi:hypothetical protein
MSRLHIVKRNSPTRAASGGTVPPEPPAGALPLDPNLMYRYAERLARMPLGKSEQAAIPRYGWHNAPGAHANG